MLTGGGGGGQVSYRVGRWLPLPIYADVHYIDASTHSLGTSFVGSVRGHGSPTAQAGTTAGGLTRRTPRRLVISEGALHPTNSIIISSRSNSIVPSRSQSFHLALRPFPTSCCCCSLSLKEAHRKVEPLQSGHAGHTAPTARHSTHRSTAPTCASRVQPVATSLSEMLISTSSCRAPLFPARVSY